MSLTLSSLKNLIAKLNSIKVFDFSKDTKAVPCLNLTDKTPKCKIIAIANQKGGCGKTTTSINLSSCLVEKGLSVLLIDFDPQAHATLGLGIDTSGLNKTIYDALLYKDVVLEDIVQPTSLPGLHIACANSLLSGALVDLAGIIGRENVLRVVIRNSKSINLYDYVIIDCSPSLSLLTINALVAATHVLIPIQTQYFSLEGMKDFLSTLNIVRERLNFDLSVLGVLPTIFDGRLNINRQILEQLREYFQGMVLKTVINMNVKLAESVLYRKPVNLYDPLSRGAQDYRSLAQEIHVILNPELKVNQEITKADNTIKEDVILNQN